MFAPPKLCSECGSTHILFDRTHDEVVCEECGLIILDAIPVDDSVLEGLSDRMPLAEGHGPACSPFSVEGLATTIDRRNRDATGRMLTQSEAALANRLRRANRRNRVNNGTMRNLAHSLHDIRQRGTAMGLPDSALARAAGLYRTAVERKVTVGRNAQRLKAGCVFIACREFGVPRSADEIAAEFMPEERSSVKARKYILKAQHLLMKELKIRQVRTSPEQYVSRFCSELDLDVNVQVECGSLLKRGAEKSLNDGSPVSIAATAVYVASRLLGKKVRQSDVARVTGVTDATLRNRSRKLAAALGLSL